VWDPLQDDSFHLELLRHRAQALLAIILHLPQSDQPEYKDSKILYGHDYGPKFPGSALTTAGSVDIRCFRRPKGVLLSRVWQTTSAGVPVSFSVRKHKFKIRICLITKRWTSRKQSSWWNLYIFFGLCLSFSAQLDDLEPQKCFLALYEPLMSFSNDGSPLASLNVFAERSIFDLAFVLPFTFSVRNDMKTRVEEVTKINLT
jgi:hypothetical protein